MTSYPAQWEFSVGRGVGSVYNEDTIRRRCPRRDKNKNSITRFTRTALFPSKKIWRSFAFHRLTLTILPQSLEFVISKTALFSINLKLTQRESCVSFGQSGGGATPKLAIWRNYSARWPSNTTPMEPQLLTGSLIRGAVAAQNLPISLISQHPRMGVAVVQHKLVNRH